MADNRMYLKCRTCGETLLIGSCISSPYEIYKFNSVHMPEQNVPDFRVALNNFYSKHFHCQNGEPVENTENQFTLAYESIRDQEVIEVQED